MSQVPSRRMAALARSDIRAMSVTCDRMGGINLAQGLSELPVPEVVLAGARRAMEAGHNRYTRHDGIGELRHAIARHLARGGVARDPEDEVVVSAGATGALYAACVALLDPGDEVIVLEPTYGYHLSTLTAVGAIARAVRLEGPAFALDPDALRAAVTPRTRAVLVNTPANPSGRVFTRGELEGLAAVAIEHDLLVLTDEIYEHHLFDGRRHLSPAALPGLGERTVTISGFSKCFHVTGWRIGYAAGPRELVAPLAVANDLVYVCAPAPLQVGVAEGLARLGAAYYDELRAGLERKRDRLCAALGSAGLTPFVPEGAYYVLADVRRLQGASSVERAQALLERTGVACVPGSAFYVDPRDGADVARFCFAKPDPVLEDACSRLARL